MAKTYSTYHIRVANRDRVQVEKWDAQHQDQGQPVIKEDIKQRFSQRPRQTRIVQLVIAGSLQQWCNLS
ncbi:hypothetical protein [Tychonema sp. BBK16]|uniref:hypothetical protein n=1 Tax=Tychonema sp. BBK16 TaxID=2699888 RepID=UPI0038D30C78